MMRMEKPRSPWKQKKGLGPHRLKQLGVSFQVLVILSLVILLKISMYFVSMVILSNICLGGAKTMIARNCPIVEREILALGSRAPSLQGPFQSGRKANAGCVQSPPVRHLGVEALVRASQISVYYPAVESEESMSLASDYYGSVFSLYRQRTFSVYSAQE